WLQLDRTRLERRRRDRGRARQSRAPPKSLRSFDTAALCRPGLRTFCRRPLRRNSCCRKSGDPVEPAVYGSSNPACRRAGLSRPERRRQDCGATAARAAARHHHRQRDPLGPLRRPEKYSSVGKRAAPGRVTRRMTATRRLVAILAADVAGYSRLMGADEEGTLERLKALRRELV